MITLKVTGSFKGTNEYLKNSKTVNSRFRKIMDRYGIQGVNALREATPKDTTLTSTKWQYRIEGWGLVFYNTNIINGTSIAILLQYGHGTRHGGYVEGRDYINPVIRPIFDKIAKDLRKEVQNL